MLRAIAYTDGLKTFKQYISRTDRWFNVRRVLKDNMRDSKKGLKTVAVWVFIEVLLPIFFLAIISYMLYIGACPSVGFILLLDFTVLTCLSFYLARKYKQSLRKVAKGVGWFRLYKFVNALPVLEKTHKA